MKSIKSFISILFLICIANAVYASPSNTDGDSPLCNPDKIVVSCDIDTSVAMYDTCPDGEYFALVYLYPSSPRCLIELHDDSFSEFYSMRYNSGVVLEELTEKLDVFTYRYSPYRYRAPLIITIKNSHIVEIRSDDVAWDRFDRWITKSCYGIDGYTLLN